MRQHIYRLHAHTHKEGRHHWWIEAYVLLIVVLLIISSPASAAMRFQERSLYMNSARAGDTTSYKISFRYMSPQPVGSVDMLFCIDPIPHHPCVTPPGLNVADAALVDQTGETGFVIQSQSANHIVLTRPAAGLTNASSSYTFDGIRNADDPNVAFAIRLRSHGTSNATGPQIDFGSVRGQNSSEIEIQTQVPPMLIFCVAEQVAENCESTNENYYSNLGELSPSSTLFTQSQMAVGTNASSGFVITANGAPMSAGTSVIGSPNAPTPSSPGVNQFGINLVSNTAPSVGRDPEGPWTNALPAATYSVPDRYKFVSGDVVASSPNVSLMRKFTVSYIVNSSPDLRAGVYTTTLTYIASGRF